MSYRLFLRMLRAGLQREATEQLQHIMVVSFPNWTNQAARTQLLDKLMHAAGWEKPRTEEQALAAIAALQGLFPSPTPEILAEIKRAQSE